jgi:hypothetical protein
MASLIQDPERAKRLARTIASDLSLFHSEEVYEGIKNDDFYERLDREIEKGKEHYCSRIDPSILSLSVYEEAIIDIILFPKADIFMQHWSLKTSH